MSDEDKKGAFYYPAGVPITPQARQFGYEFPVYVSRHVWSAQCMWVGSYGRQHTNTELRIRELLEYCFIGMTKKLAVEDDFLWYDFKIWWWCPVNRDRKKKRRTKLGARLFLDPDTGGPWLYLFNTEEDATDELKRGTDPAAGKVADESANGSSEADRPAIHIHGEVRDIRSGRESAGTGELGGKQTDGRDRGKVHKGSDDLPD